MQASTIVISVFAVAVCIAAWQKSQNESKGTTSSAPKSKPHKEISVSSEVAEYRYDDPAWRPFLNPNLTIPCMGISYGTSTVVAAVWHDGKVVIVPPTAPPMSARKKQNPTQKVENSDGPSPRLRRSIVGFKGASTFVVREEAEALEVSHPRDVVFAAKRFVGRSYQAQNLTSLAKVLPFTVTTSRNRPRFIPSSVQGNNDVLISPEEVIAITLRQVQREAERLIGTAVYSAIITVPTDFDFTQRRALVQAAQLAGLQVSLMRESTAAAVSILPLLKQRDVTSNDGEYDVFVVNFGAGYFDVMIANVDTNFGVITIDVTDGSGLIGGIDIDNILVNYFVQSFQSLYHVDLKNNATSMARLRRACVAAKEHLSRVHSTVVEVEELLPSKGIHETLTRMNFEDLIQPLLQKAEKLVRQLKREVATTRFDYVLLVGGSSNIPSFRELIKRILPKTKVIDDVDLVNAPALGAAVYAASLVHDGTISNIDLVAITEAARHNIGVELNDKHMSVLMNRSQQLPCTISGSYTTTHDNQETLKIRLFEGNSPLTAYNALLGSFTVDNIPKAAKGTYDVEVQLVPDNPDSVIVKIALLQRKKHVSSTKAYVVAGNEKLLMTNQERDKSALVQGLLLRKPPPPTPAAEGNKQAKKGGNDPNK